MKKSLKKPTVSTIVAFVILLVLVLMFIFPIRIKIAASYLIKADKFYSIHDFKNAQKNYSKAVFWNSANEDGKYFRYAVADYNLNAYDNAIKLYTFSLGDKANNPITVFNNIGNIYRAKKDYNAALEYYNLAMSLINNDIAKNLDKAPYINKIGTLVAINKCQEAKDQSNLILSDDKLKKYFSKNDFSGILSPCK